MPELPEVETTVRYLRKKLVGLRFKDAWADWAKTVKQAGGISNLKKEIKNKKILSVRRRAKFITIDIEGDKTLFIHQKISGHLLYGKWKFKDGKWASILKGPMNDDPDNKYIRVVFYLNNGYQLALSDLRRFGKIILVKDKDVSKLPEIKNLGPEPLEITFKEFKKLFVSAGWRKKGRIKQVLMDPFFIVGIGNIYADEILWSSGLHPLSRTENLSDKDIKSIYNYMIKILKHAIKLGGSSIKDYRAPSGEAGEYQNQTKAYHHEGEKCARRDGGIIKRIKLGGRSAHFCSKHQKLV